MKNKRKCRKCRKWKDIDKNFTLIKKASKSRVCNDCKRKNHKEARIRMKNYYKSKDKIKS